MSDEALTVLLGQIEDWIYHQETDKLNEFLTNDIRDLSVPAILGILALTRGMYLDNRRDFVERVRNRLYNEYPTTTVDGWLRIRA